MNTYIPTPPKRPVSASAVVRIVIWSVVLAILVALFVLGMLQAAAGSGHLQLNWKNISFGGYTYEGADTYQVGGGTTEDTVRDIDIDWLNGCIQIIPTDEAVVSIEESYSGEREELCMRWRVVDGKLTVKYRAPYWMFGITESFPDKNLTIYVPRTMLEDMGRVSVEAVEADMTFVGNATAVSLEAVEGDMTVTGSVGALDVDTVEGAITFTGALGEGDIDGVETTVIMHLTAARSLDIDGVENDVTLYLSDAFTGFSVLRDGIGSGVTVDEVAFDDVSQHGDYEAYWGDGSFRVDMDGVSAKLFITKETKY